MKVVDGETVRVVFARAPVLNVTVVAVVVVVDIVEVVVVVVIGVVSE